MWAGRHFQPGRIKLRVSSWPGEQCKKREFQIRIHFNHKNNIKNPENVTNVKIQKAQNPKNPKNLKSNNLNFRAKNQCFLSKTDYLSQCLSGNAVLSNSRNVS